MKIFAALILISSFALAPTAMARQSTDRAQAIEDQVTDLQNRLQLTEEQQALVEPTLRAQLETSRAIMEDYGFSPGTSGGNVDRRKMRSMSKELEPVRKQAERDLTEVLTDEQMDEYREIQDERRARMRNDIKRRMGR